MSITVWHNTMEAYLTSLATVIGIMVCLLRVRRIMIRYFSRQARQRDHDGYDFMLAVAQRTLFPLMLLVALYAGKGLLAIHHTFEAEGVVFGYPTRTIHLEEDRPTDRGGAVKETHGGADAFANAAQNA